MNISKEQWQRIGGIVLFAVLAIAAVLGWVFPMPAPVPSEAETRSVGVVGLGAEKVKALNVQNDAKVGGSLDIGANADVVGSLSIGSVTFSGPVKYGTSATYATGASIAHGFATTPTVCILWPAEITATLTITSTGFSSDTAAHSSPVYWMCGK